MLEGGGVTLESSHSAGVHREADQDSDLSLELSQKIVGANVQDRTIQQEIAVELRHWVNGVGRGGGQTDFNQISRNPVKVRLKSGKIRSKSLEIMCFGGYSP